MDSNSVYDDRAIDLDQPRLPSDPHHSFNTKAGNEIIRNEPSISDYLKIEIDGTNTKLTERTKSNLQPFHHNRMSALKSSHQY